MPKKKKKKKSAPRHTRRIQALKAQPKERTQKVIPSLNKNPTNQQNQLKALRLTPCTKNFSKHGQIAPHFQRPSIPSFPNCPKSVQRSSSLNLVMSTSYKS